MNTIELILTLAIITITALLCFAMIPSRRKRKTSNLAVLLFAAMTAAISANADEPKSYLENISVSPYATVVHNGISDGESYGTGLALSYGVNPFVSIELSATTYSDNDWRDEAVDESALFVKARLLKDESERLSLYAIAGGDRDWGRDDWALSAGAGVQLRVHKNVALFADSRLRAWLSANEGKSKDISTRVGLTIIIPGS